MPPACGLLSMWSGTCCIRIHITDSETCFEQGACLDYSLLAYCCMTTLDERYNRESGQDLLHDCMTWKPEIYPAYNVLRAAACCMVQDDQVVVRVSASELVLRLLDACTTQVGVLGNLCLQCPNCVSLHEFLS